MFSNRAFGLVLLPVLIALGMGGFLTVYFSRNLEQNRYWVLHTYQVMDRARLVLAEVQEAQMAQRDYLLTQEEGRLVGYRSSVERLPGILAELDRLTEMDSRQQARVEQLRSTVERRIDVLQRAIEGVQSRGFEALREIIGTGAGREAMGQIRRIVQEIVAEEEDLLRSRVEATRWWERRALYATVAGSVVGLIGLLIVAALVIVGNQALRTSQREATQKAMLLQATLDNVREGIAAFDASGRLEAFNARFFRLLRLPAELARPGLRIEELRGTETLSKTPGLRHALFGRVDAARDGFPVVVGRRHLEVYRDVTADGGLIVSCFDVTRRTQAEEAARQAQKMEAIGHLTGGVAHDFNNLLQVISSNLDLLAADLGANARASLRLRNAMAGAQRGARLTRQLLAFARREPLEPRAVNVGRQLREMSELLRRTLGERIEIETVVAEGLWNIRVDPTRLESALLNLAINSRDAMPDGGKLTVEALNAPLGRPDVADMPEVAAGDYVMVRIADTGWGMDSRILARAFEPFFTTKAEGQGTGLGLSQVFGFVKQSGGHIRIESEPLQGTTVTIYLPRTDDAEERPPAAPSIAAEGGSETILVLEDDAEVRRAVADTLTSLGYRVLEADTVEVARRILSGPERIDVLFSDVIMPGPVQPTDFVRGLRWSHPELAVLFTSGYSEIALEHRDELDHGVQLLSKPYRKDDLARRIRQILAMPRSHPSPVAIPSEADELPEPDSPARPLRVLVVEDEIFVRLTTIDMLTELGHAPLEADSGRAALKVMDDVGAVDLLLTDVGLPDIRGPALASECRRRCPGISVIFATGYDALSLEAEKDAIVLGKPFDMSDLRRALAVAAERRASRASAM